MSSLAFILSSSRESYPTNVDSPVEIELQPVGKQQPRGRPAARRQTDKKVRTAANKLKPETP